MQPANVLYLVRTWAFGGSHTIVLSLLEHLPRDRFNVICVPYDAHSPGDAEFIEQAATRSLAVADERIRWRSGRDWFRARRQVSDLISKHRIDLLHTHDPHSNIMIGIGRGRWPVPVIASAYGWWDGPLGRRRVHQRIERDYALPKFDRVITVSDDMRGRVLEGPAQPDRVHVVRTGLAPAPECGRGALRSAFGIPSDAIVVGTLGRVSAEKGHKHLLDAAAQLLPSSPDLYFVITGNGPELENLKQKSSEMGLADRMVFTGFFDNAHAALADFDVFAFPSIEREGLPTAVLEAQQAGLPVVASDIGGTNEAMVAGTTGVLVQPGDVPSLAASLNALISDAKSRREMGTAAAAWVADNFSINSMIENVSALYDAVIQESRHARRD